jgi:hypothetical protein
MGSSLSDGRGSCQQMKWYALEFFLFVLFIYNELMTLITPNLLTQNNISLSIIISKPKLPLT